MSRKAEIEPIFQAWYRPLCLYALHYLGNPDAAEDVVQEVFISLWKQDGPIDNAKAWLHTAVRNRCIDQLRRSKTKELPLPCDLDGPISDEEAFDRSAVEARLWAAVEALPEKRRQCLIMAKRDGMSYQEIADELGLSENTVRNHISRALETLRQDRRQISGLFFFFF